MSKKLKNQSGIMTDPLPESEIMKDVDKEIESIEYVEKIHIHRNRLISNILYDCSIALVVVTAILIAVLKNSEATIIITFIQFISLGSSYFFFKIFAERNHLNKIRKILYRTFITLSALSSMVALALN